MLWRRVIQNGTLAAPSSSAFVKPFAEGQTAVEAFDNVLEHGFYVLSALLLFMRACLPSFIC
jgi:hypothetical protein